MTTAHWKLTRDPDGLAWLAFDREGETTNTFSSDALRELRQRAEQLRLEPPRGLAILSSDDDFLRTAVRTAIQSALEAEMTEALAAERSERVGSRLGYRSGFYSRSLITRVGTIELRVPRDRFGLFSTELFDRYQRS